MNLPTLQRRFDQIAIGQLRAEVVRLAAENDRLHAENAGLTERAVHAEDVAEGWRMDALDLQLELCQQNGTQPGITVDGQLVTA